MRARTGRAGRGWLVALIAAVALLLGRVGMIAYSIRELGASGDDVTRLVVETVLVFVGTIAIALALVAATGAPVLIREFRLRRSAEDLVLIRAIRSFRTESALAELIEFPPSGPHLLPWIYSVTVAPNGITLARGAISLRTVFAVSWNDVESVDVENLEDTGAFVAFLVLRVKSRKGDSVDLPVAILSGPLVRFNVLDEAGVRERVETVLAQRIAFRT